MTDSLQPRSSGDDFPPSLDDLRIAIVHPFLISQGGGEKVVDALARLFPQAELFTLLLDRTSLSPDLKNRRIHTTFLNRIPGAARRYQFLSPLYDAAAARHRLDGFDIVISSGGPGAKTVKLPAGVLHIHYCHSPVRFLWDQHDAWQARLPKLLRPLFALSSKAQRRRDMAGVARTDEFVANSDYIAARIRRFYHRESVTIYPPVAVNRRPVPGEGGDYYLTVGRLVPGKRTELIIEACNRLGRQLVVAGGGPEEERLRSIAGPTVRVAGRVTDAELLSLYRGARAFLFAADEDFGIATVEAQSFGLPAIAYGHGGSLEILSGDADAPDSGVFFAEQSVTAIVAAIEAFEADEGGFDRIAISRRAERFSEERFADRMQAFVARCWETYQSGADPIQAAEVT
jgi:glycosyltransferase involved in cell wall biosynthesis